MRLTVTWKLNLLVLGGLLLLLGTSVLMSALQASTLGEEKVRLALVGAATAASFTLDPALVATLEPLQSNGEAYQSTDHNLKHLSEVFLLSDLYVVRPVGTSGSWEFVFDTADGPFDENSGPEGGFSAYEAPPQELTQAWAGTEPVVTARPYSDEYGTFRSAFVTLSDENGAPVAVVGADFNLEQLLAARQAGLLVALGLAAGGLGLMGLLTWILGRMVGRPLAEVSQRFSALASGGGDLTHALAVRGRDELADLATGFNAFIAKLSSLVHDLQSGVQETSRIQTLLQAESEEATGAVTRTRAGLETLNGLGVRLEEAVKSVLVSLEAIVVQETKLDALAQEQESTTVLASRDHQVLDRAASDLRAEADEVSRALASIDTESAENGRRMDAGLGVLHKLQQAVQAVTGIVETLVNTAETTGLLAMNASIEAAHAGVQGRGFSVIAQRMRQQAETSHSDADRIGATLEGMVALIGEAAAHVEQTSITARATRERLGQTSLLVGKLTQSSEELESYTQRSRAVIEGLQGTSREVAQAAGAMASDTLNITFAVRSLQDASETMLRENGTILAGTRNVAGVVESIQTVALQLAQVSLSLEDNLRRFKTH